MKVELEASIILVNGYYKEDFRREAKDIKVCGCIKIFILNLRKTK